MSKLETPLTRRYWRQVGGTLIEEFPPVRQRKDRGQRLIDGIILPVGEHKIAHWKDVSIEGKDTIVVQTRRGRLGMYLMGQALLSVELMKRFNPKYIEPVALCEKYNAVLGPMIEVYPGIEVVLCPGDDH
jgi:hypothetical protein